MESLDQRRRLEVREKARNVFCDDPTSVWSHWGVTQHRIFIKFFFDFAWIFSLFSLVFRTSKFLEIKEFNKTIIPFALVGYETGYSQLGATRLVGYLLERFSIAFTANGKCQAEISRLQKTRKIYLVSAYILPVATAMEQVLKTEK